MNDLNKIQEFVDLFQAAREISDVDAIQNIREDMAIYGIQHLGEITSEFKLQLDVATSDYEYILAQKKVEYLGELKPNTANLQLCKLKAEADTSVYTAKKEVDKLKAIYLKIQKVVEQYNHLSHAISSRLKIELKF